ncbi:MAG: glycerol-3-phosphate acyltransferase [bacterium]|nr:glycerol-3-phosphate acyltransferase [bacterium]
MILLFAAAYLIGCIPVGYIVGKLNGIDVFNTGSGNMGANNIARALGYFWGGLTWFLDSMKGVAAILLLRLLTPPDQMGMATVIGAVGAIIGHTWSLAVYAITGRLRGGKGAATAIGTWLTFIPPVMVAVIMSIWVLVVVITRYVSLAVLLTTGLVAAGVIVMVATNFFAPVYLLYLVVPVIVFYRHRENIIALREGRERKLGQRV